MMKNNKTVHMNCFVYRLTGPEATGLCGETNSSTYCRHYLDTVRLANYLAK